MGSQVYELCKGDRVDSRIHELLVSNFMENAKTRRFLVETIVVTSFVRLPCIFSQF